MDEIKKYNILRIKGKEAIEEEDIVVVEKPFTIYLNDKELITLLCSPKSLKYLAIGFLNSEGLINSKDDIEKIKIDEDKGFAYVHTINKGTLSEELLGKRTITSGCGKGTTFYNVIDSFKTKKIKKIISLNKEKISSLVRDFSRKSELKAHLVKNCCVDDNS